MDVPWQTVHRIADEGCCQASDINWPSAPMLNRLHWKPIATPSPASMYGTERTRLSLNGRMAASSCFALAGLDPDSQLLDNFCRVPKCTDEHGRYRHPGWSPRLYLMLPMGHERNYPRLARVSRSEKAMINPPITRAVKTARIGSKIPLKNAFADKQALPKIARLNFLRRGLGWFCRFVAQIEPPLFQTASACLGTDTCH